MELMRGGFGARRVEFHEYKPRTPKTTLFASFAQT
jgi:hypothetical protein